MLEEDDLPHLLARISANSFPLQLIEAEVETNYFGPLARAILRSDEIYERRALPWKFKSIAEFGEEEFICDSSASNFWSDRQWQKQVIAEYSHAVARNLWFHEDGLLFYVSDGSGGYRLAAQGDDSYDFVLRLLEEDSVGDLRFSAPPRWASELFLSHANYEAYCAIWHDTSDTSDRLYETRKRVRREAVLAETRRSTVQGVQVPPSSAALPDVPRARAVKDWQATLDRKKNGLLEMMNELLEQHRDALQVAICCAVLQRPSGIDIPLALFALDEKDKALEAKRRKRFIYMADLLLRRREGALGLPNSDYCSIAQWIESEADLSDLNLAGVQFHSTGALHCWHDYFNAFADPLSWAVANATNAIFHGVAPYRIASDGQMQRLPPTDPLFHYLFFRGQAFDVVTDITLPEWTRSLYFKRDHLEWHSIIFASMEENDEVAPDEVNKRRLALWRQVGLDPVEAPSAAAAGATWPWGEHSTEALGNLAAAAERWWARFDPGDPSTAPTNDVVSAWLVDERKVSKRLADAIATMLRADGLPTGPRI